MPLREKKLIQQIRRSARRQSSSAVTLTTGIGDDCAVLRVPPGHELLVTTDFNIENVHFRRDWHPPELVGWRCLTRGLSDIAAMGGQPLAAFLSLAVAAEVPQKWVNGFLKGLLTLAKEFNVPLAGGDTAQSPSGIQADIVVVGSVPKGQAILRSGAKPGDQIYVTGELGGAAAILARLTRSKPQEPADLRHSRPMPRLAIGQWLRQRHAASSMIDLSDGLSTDLAHIGEESGVGAELDATAIPRAHLGQQKLGRHKKQHKKEGSEPATVALDQALHGGDDYELLFTSSASIPPKIAGIKVTRIGQITKSSPMRLIGTDGKSRPLNPSGWEHFTKNP